MKSIFIFLLLLLSVNVNSQCKNDTSLQTISAVDTTIKKGTTIISMQSVFDGGLLMLAVLLTGNMILREKILFKNDRESI